MEVHCKVCGRPLHDPESIARGMGRQCAGLGSSRKRFSSPRVTPKGSRYVANQQSRLVTVEPIFTTLPDKLKQFSPDLIQLVLFPPPPGLVAGSLLARQLEAHRASRKWSPIDLKCIRRLCIDLRLMFWPGIFTNLESLPCIPCGNEDWKIGNNGRIRSKNELVGYLTRCGMISPP